MGKFRMSKLPDFARAAILIAALPIWLPLIMLVAVGVLAGRWVIIRWHVWRPIESAWNKCAAVWLREGWVWIAWCDALYSHGLQLALAKAHRRQRTFFLKQLTDPQPILAAYACLCVRACGGVGQNEISNAMCERQEVLSIRCGDMIERQALGEFLGGLLPGREKYANEADASATK